MAPVIIKKAQVSVSKRAEAAAPQKAPAKKAKATATKKAAAKKPALSIDELYPIPPEQLDADGRPIDPYRVKDEHGDGWEFDQDIRDNTLEQLGIPSLLIRTRYRSDGTGHYSVNTYDNFSTGAAPVSNVRAVGKIENDEPVGRILFKQEFIEEYPQLKKVTVYRLAPQFIRYVEAPLTNNCYEREEAIRKAAQKAKAAATRAAKKAAAAEGAAETAARPRS